MHVPTIHEARAGLRMAVSYAGRVLPQGSSVALERRMRGWEESHKLAACDAVVASYGKAGRTWLRVMISRYFAHSHGLDIETMMEFDEFHRRDSRIPILFFTHDNYLPDYTGTDDKWKNYAGKKVVLLVRDPRDTAVSQYFQWKSRIRARKKIINGYPLGETDLYDFIAGDAAGIPKIIRFMNAWAESLPHMKEALVVRYEDLRTNTHEELAKVLRFVGAEVQAASLDEAISYASVENMRRIEQGNAGNKGYNQRLKPTNANDPSSFKVRRAKVGGWQDYLTDEQTATVNDMVEKTLAPVFGYGAK